MPPSTRIITDQTVLSLGAIGHHAECKFPILLSNIGVREGTFSIISEEQNFVLTPTSGTILPGKSFEVSAVFTPHQLGDHKFEILTTLEGVFEEGPKILVMRLRSR